MYKYIYLFIYQEIMVLLFVCRWLIKSHFIDDWTGMYKLNKVTCHFYQIKINFCKLYFFFWKTYFSSIFHVTCVYYLISIKCVFEINFIINKNYFVPILISCVLQSVKYDIFYRFTSHFLNQISNKKKPHWRCIIPIVCVLSNEQSQNPLCYFFRKKKIWKVILVWIIRICVQLHALNFIILG